MNAVAPDTPARWPLTPEGIWLECRRAACAMPCPALMLDRDGVVIEDREYLADPDGVVLLPGIAALIGDANGRAMPVCVVTNQSGIDRGLYGWDAFAAVNERIDALLAAEGAHIDAIAACPFHPDFTAGYGAAHARWRKPGPGLIETLVARLNLDAGRSWLVGDSARDIEAARAAGLAGGVLLGAESVSRSEAGFTHHGVATLDAARRILAGSLPGAENTRP